MSLINDALKRANEQKAKQVTAGELGSTMQVVDCPPDETRLWPIALFAALLVGALWLGWSGLHSNSHSNPAASGSSAAEVNARVPEPASAVLSPPGLEPATRPPAPLPGTPELPAAEIARGSAVPPVRALAATHPARTAVSAQNSTASRPAVTLRADSPSIPVPTAAPAAAEVAVVAPLTPSAPVPNTFPQLSLQGIYYRPARPSAVINSKTVYVGDKVQQAKILAIDRYEVTVQWNNEVRVLAFH